MQLFIMQSVGFPPNVRWFPQLSKPALATPDFLAGVDGLFDSLSC